MPTANMQTHRKTKLAVLAIVTMVLTLALSPLVARAASVKYSGTWGTCSWEVGTDGVLTVHPGQGAEQVLIDDDIRSPWDAYASSITSIVFKKENGQTVKAPVDARCLFADLYKVKTIDFTGFNTSSTQDMHGMFWYCTALTSLNLSSFNTRNVKFMGSMFYGCSKLTSINLSSFDTTRTTMMWNMFYGCSSLTSLDLSSFDTSNTWDMHEMFSDCTSLTSLDLSSFDTSSVQDMREMFCNCTSLRKIVVSAKWSTAIVRDYGEDMFLNCTSLVGGNGTRYSSSYTDKTYARVDKAGAPGYLTGPGGSTVHAPGWAYENGAYCYYKNDGTKVKGNWIAYGGKYYYFGADGKLVVNGWVKYAGKYYYMNKNANPVVNGWIGYKGSYYHFNAKGVCDYVYKAA